MREKELKNKRGKSKFMVVGRERVVLYVEVEMSGEIMEVVSSCTHLGSCFSKDEGPQEDLKKSVGVSEGLKSFGALSAV